MLTHRPPPAEAFQPKADTVFIENASHTLPVHAPDLSSPIPHLTAEPITHAAFAPYGDLIQAYPSREAAPDGIEVTAGNGGTALKFNWLAKIEETYPAGRLVRGGLSVGVMRQGAHHDVSQGKEITVTTLERHACTTQAFIPMGKTAPSGKEQLPAGGAMIVVVAQNGKDDKPDVATMKAFLVSSSQGVSYHAGMWHHGMLTVDAQSDYAVLEAQIGDGDDILDLEKYTPSSPYCTISVPPYSGQHLSLAPPTTGYSSSSTLPPAPNPSSSSNTTITNPAQLTPAAFAPYGHVIQTYPDPAERLPVMEVHSNPAGKAIKYTRLAPIVSNYPAEVRDQARTAVSVMRTTVRQGLKRGEVFDVKFMERHPYTSQAFVPMGKAESRGTKDAPLPPGGAMLIIVADNGPDDRPDPKTIKSFVMESNMGVSYGPGVWHHPTIVMDETMDLACIDTQLTTGAHGPVDPRDLELLEYSDEELFGRILIPTL